jgi:putative ABC transport system substrate-binding protein
VKVGALAGVGVGWYATGVRSASFVARILNGENPAGIPIEDYVEEQITLNHEVAKDLNIVFPEKYLTETIQRDPGKTYKFCLVHFVDSPVSEDAEKGIRDELKNRGMTEGEDFTMKVFRAQGDVSILANIAGSVANEQWDLVFTLSTPTIQLLSQKIISTPIVFCNVGDPVAAGLGESYEKHLPGLTGISTMSKFEDLVILVKETIPGAKKLGTIFTPGEINSVVYKEELEKAVKRQGLELVAVPANSTTEVSDAARVIVNKGIEAFTQISDNLTASCGTTIIKTARDSKIPYFSYVEKQIDQGAIAIVSSDYYYAGIDAVGLAVQILNGTPPSAIPFRKVSKSVVKVNEDAMKYFNVKVPAKYFNN